MFDLAEQAQAIEERLGGMAGLEQVLFLDDGGDVPRTPFRMPAAQILLDDVTVEGSRARITWTILARAKNLTGPAGVLALADSIAARLHGLVPVPGHGPLRVVKIGYFDRTGEESAYGVSLETCMPMRACMDA